MSSAGTIQSRRQKYFHLSSEIAQIDDARLRVLFDDGPSSTGWGRNHTLEIGGLPVFVKRVPVTDAEMERRFSTANLYHMPVYYNYGVGSAGFGVFRELVANIRTTNWVLDGEIETFPLLYHHRIVPASGERPAVDAKRHEDYVRYWGGSEEISRYSLDRANAGHELVLFLEHVPHVLQPWLEEHPDRMPWALDELRKTIDFLRAQGIIHFDAHFHNILTDGEDIFLTDFGLALDRAFTLDEAEKAFFAAHTHYDYGEVLSCLGYFVHLGYEAMAKPDQCRVRERCGVPDGDPDQRLLTVLLENIEAFVKEGLISLDENVVDCVIRYRSVTVLMREFYTSLRRNTHKDTLFPHERLQGLLRETGFLR